MPDYVKIRENLTKRRALAQADEAEVRHRVDQLVERSARARRASEGLVVRSRELLATADTKLALALTAARAGEWDLDLDTGQLAHSARLDKVLGNLAVSGGSIELFLDRLLPEHAARLRQRFGERFPCEWHEEVVFGDSAKDGIWLSLRARLMVKGDGAPCRVVGVVTDITERRRTQEHLAATLSEKEMLLRDKDFLIREIHHRVKNNLQMVGSLLSIQSRSIRDETAKALFDQALARVRVIARVHQRLYTDDELNSVELSRHLRDLVTDLYAANGWEQAPLELDLQPCEVTLDTAVPASMALHELLVNAMKYAYDGKPGWIGISLKAPGRGRPSLQLAICDRGRGLDPDAPPGLGTRLVQSFARQLGASLKYGTPRSGGTRIMIAWVPRNIRNDESPPSLA